MSDVLKPQLWTERPVDETRAVYAGWADQYDADLAGRGYHTPRRLAGMLARHLPKDPRPVLDFGCGTGLSGLALRSAGIAPLHGTDITPEMLAQAEPKRIYDMLWHSAPGATFEPGTYRAIAAIGVISLGAAPPEAMDPLIEALLPGDLLAMSFNDKTLEHGTYDAHLQTQLDAGRVAILDREHGPHLDDVSMGSDVIILSRGG